MKKAILAKKIGMTQIFNEDGSLTPVTVLQAGPCVVTQVKTVENDGYSAVQVGFEEKRANLVSKPKKGVFEKAGTTPKRFVRELKLDNAEELKAGDEIKADIFEVGDHIDATAISKGKGFQGAIHRLGQHRGTSSDPSRVFKGKGMPGQMGAKRITIQNLEVVRVDADNNLLLVKGSVPGAKKCLVTVRETVKAKK